MLIRLPVSMLFGGIESILQVLWPSALYTKDYLITQGHLL